MVLTKNTFQLIPIPDNHPNENRSHILFNSDQEQSKYFGFLSWVFLPLPSLQVLPLIQ